MRAPLFVVADGMGGAQAGEVASEMAVETFAPGLPDGGSPGEGLKDLIEEANRDIHERSRTHSGRAGMGTTVTAAHVGENTVTIAHVGDSRCYLYRDGELTRLTEDHSLVEELIKRGKLTPDQAETHPQRSVITRALGPEPDVQVDVVEDARPRRRPVHDLLGRPDVDGARAAADAAAGRQRPPARGSRPRADRRGQRRRRARQHHDHPLPARRRSRSARACSTPRPRRYEIPNDGDTNEYQTFSGEAVAEPRQGVSRPTGHTRTSDEAVAREAEYRASGTVALSAVRPRAQPIEEEDRPHAPPRRDEAPPRKRRVRLVLAREADRPRLASSAWWPPSGSRRDRCTSSASTRPVGTS